MLSGNVPDHLGDVVQLLAEGNDREVELMVPKKLKRIQDVADKCRNLAQEVNKSFLFVMNLIQELLMACTSEEKHRSDQLEKNIAAKKVCLD